MRWIRILIVAAPAALTLLLPAHAVPGSRGGDDATLFHASDRCLACHNGLVGPDGTDLSIGADWRGSMMANAARDPYWQAAVRRETLDHPQARAAIEDECSKCHMPMAHTTSHAAGEEGRLFAHLTSGGGGDPGQAHLAMDGVSCSACHQIRSDGLGQESSFVGGFVIDTATPLGDRDLFGPFEVDGGRQRIMSSASGFQPQEGDHLRSAGLCATCHTLITHALGPDGQVIGELAEQVPYSEWEHSVYGGGQTCQQCHMPELDEPTAITSVWPQPREGMSPHVFRGGNSFIPRVLNLNRAELQVEALPAELAATSERSAAHVESAAATVEIEDDGSLLGDELRFVVAVENLAGHKFPTAYPSRRAWLHVTVRDTHAQVVFESGAPRADGSIAGNDNDEDGALYEPHYREVTDPGQVQIYEPILGDSGGEVTTGLLKATTYLKDNRLLPWGFDKATAGPWIEVHGAARDDVDFTGGGDRTHFTIDTAGFEGPLAVEVQLWFQSIGYRWAHNLGVMETDESRRFLGYYDGLAHTSATLAARDVAAFAASAETPSETP